MPKNIIVCCDGTGNEIKPDCQSNVLELYQRLDKSRPEEQVTYYDPGLGTLPAPGVQTGPAKFLTKLMGLAFAYGLPTDIKQAYRFLMRTYEEGDRIFLFGFSRGAYTVRALAGLIYMCGLLDRHCENLVDYAMELHRKRSKGQPPWQIAGRFRKYFPRRWKDESGGRPHPLHRHLGHGQVGRAVPSLPHPALHRQAERLCPRTSRGLDQRDAQQVPPEPLAPGRRRPDQPGDRAAALPAGLVSRRPLRRRRRLPGHGLGRRCARVDAGRGQSPRSPVARGLTRAVAGSVGDDSQPPVALLVGLGVAPEVGRPNRESWPTPAWRSAGPRTPSSIACAAASYPARSST